MKRRLIVAGCLTALLVSPRALAQLQDPDMLARPCDTDWTVTGDDGDHIGVFLGAGGDLDLDGRQDFLISTLHAAQGTEVCPIPEATDNVVQLWDLGFDAQAQFGPQQLLQITNVGKPSQQAITVAYVGDLNNGGRDDFAIGVPAWPKKVDLCGDQNRGQVFIFLGESFPVLANLPIVLDAEADADIIIRYTNIPNRRFGHALASAGNVNANEGPSGDPYEDLLIGAPGCSDNDVNSPCANEKGEVHVFLGGPLGLRVLDGLTPPASGPWVLTDLAGDWVVLGASQRDRMGWSAVGLGDLDGDGDDEFAAGSPQFSIGTRNKAPDAPGLTLQENGFGTVSICDWSSGTVSVIAAPTLQSPEHNLVGAFGFSVSPIGDVDGDFVSDFVVGAPDTMLGGEEAAGSVFVYSGLTALAPTPLPIAQVVPPDFDSDPSRAERTYFGWSVVGLQGDVSVPADSFPDWVAGAWRFSDEKQLDDGDPWSLCSGWMNAGIGGDASGRAYVMSGDPTGAVAFPKLLTIGGQDNHPNPVFFDKGRLSFGMAAGLLDDDSEPDLILSAFALKQEDDPVMDHGRVYLISGITLESKITNPGPP